MSPDQWNEAYQQQLKRDFGEVLKTREGRHVLWWVLEKAGIYQTSFSDVDDRHTNYREGQRAMGLKLLQQLLTSDPGSLTIMQGEDLERQAQKERAVSRDTPTGYGEE